MVEKSESSSPAESGLCIVTGNTDSDSTSKSDVSCEIADVLPCPVIGNRSCCASCDCQSLEVGEDTGLETDVDIEVSLSDLEICDLVLSADNCI